MPVALPPRAQHISRRFAHLDVTGHRAAYLRYHAPRYEALLAVVTPLVADLRERFPGTPPQVLDVGVSYQTELLRQLVPDGRVDDLGFTDPLFPTPSGARHVPFDLNDARLPDRVPELRGYHLVTLCETIEHLWIGPQTLLQVFARAIVPGGFLVVQTPNAVALHKRLRMVVGRPPIAPLPEGDHPGVAHLHEYTTRELVDGASRAGFTLHEVRASNYFGAGLGARAYSLVGRVTPPSLRHGLTVTFTPTGP